MVLIVTTKSLHSSQEEDRNLGSWTSIVKVASTETEPRAAIAVDLQQPLREFRVE